MSIGNQLSLLMGRLGMLERLARVFVTRKVILLAALLSHFVCMGGQVVTAKSGRHVGVPDEIMERLSSWISRLPSRQPDDCVVPSSSWINPYGRKAS